MTWADYLDQQQSRFQEEMLDFLRIPSISALSEHAGDVKQAGEWVVRRLQAAGMEHVELFPTAGHPVVYGDWLHAAGKPTVLIYGHFDTQPADPLELWNTPPFEPTVRDGRVYARGASDDKGNMLVPILAVEALLQSDGSLPVNVKFIFEGQEEIGSPQTPSFIAAHRDLLACDMVISSDGGQHSETEPSILVGLKGACAVQIDMQGARSDLHSGSYGGAVQNPNHAMAQLLASMRGTDGKILVEGFYDDVVPLSQHDRELIAEVPFDQEVYQDELDVDALFGEAGYSPVERTWARPTLEVNGMWGGFQGEGIKTVLPNQAHAKITCRLVAYQDPNKIVELIRAHVKKHAPVGVRTTVQQLPFTATAYLMAPDHPGNQAAHAVLEELYGRAPYYVRTGGSIPVCSVFLKELGAYTVGFGFGLPDEQLHAPNEFFRLSSFTRGQTAYCKLLERLAA